MAQENFKPSVEVSGDGIVRVIPDEVTISVRVENTGNNAQEVKRKNDQTISDVLNFVKNQGIAEKYVRTEYVNLNKNYDYNTKTYNYSANQSISIKLIELKKYEMLMKGLLESGINRIDGVNFSSSKKAELESEARKKAVANAKEKANEYAGELNQKIGKALSIRENIVSNIPQPMLRSAMMMDSQASGSEQTMAPGEMEIYAKVYITFELF